MRCANVRRLGRGVARQILVCNGSQGVDVWSVGRRGRSLIACESTTCLCEAL